MALVNNILLNIVFTQELRKKKAFWVKMIHFCHLFKMVLRAENRRKCSSPIMVPILGLSTLLVLVKYVLRYDLPLMVMALSADFKSGGNKSISIVKIGFLLKKIGNFHRIALPYPSGSIINSCFLRR